ncbi:ACT domain-containing protein [Aestuariivivens sediminis]|uniref:ACT domain-containing protein n=1 Tax=Aestuariivivens sediminis TaxID=2913557 RepID=UPI001F57CE03|nr:ACT domain-containing protein [Aestuariivivens sediminis]
MSGEKQLRTLVRHMSPRLNEGTFVFVVTHDLDRIDRTKTLCEIKEPEGTTVILKKDLADQLGLSYDYEASWITLCVHASLEAVGLTALFSNALAEHKISCNVIAGYYHDHLFLPKNDADKAMQVLRDLSASYE